LVVLAEDFGGIDEISRRVKSVTGVASKEKIVGVLDEVWHSLPGFQHFNRSSGKQ